MTSYFFGEISNFRDDGMSIFLCEGCLLLIWNQSVRFLTDYINGDTYYKISYPEHNLVRTKAQLELLYRIEDRMEAIREALQVNWASSAS